MSEEIIQDIELDEEIDEVEEDVEEIEEDVEESQDESDDEEEEIDWEARARKAEETLIKHKRVTKAQKKEAPKKVSQKTNSEVLTREEAILFAKDYSIEAVDNAKKVAQLEGVGLLEAIETDVYKAWSDAQEKRAEREAAELPPSQGSKRRQKSKDFVDSLSGDEHEALWKKTMGM